jgi:hypothetical protein
MKQLGTEIFKVEHAEYCNQNGELCSCIKLELRKLFDTLNNYQDQVIELEAKIMELKSKKNG